MTEAEGRVRPFYCPYCGEEDFVPDGDEPARFLCNSCSRRYVLRFLELVPHEPGGAA